MCPYLDPETKADIQAGALSINVGELTYAIQQTLKHYLEGLPPSYKRLAECLGALEGAKADFIDRVLLPYEREKRRINGDVWPHKEERPA